MTIATEIDPPAAARAKTAAEAAAALSADAERGLAEPEAAARLGRFGPNALPARPPEPTWRRIIRQFREPMAVLLMAAAAVAGLGLHERGQAVAILAIVVLNAAVGVVQEGKAARAVEALRSMEAPSAQVIRAGTRRRIPATELVPGDLVVLAAGDRVPADLRLATDAALEIDESLLTGESLPVTKSAAPPADGPPSERAEMVFAGTFVARGSGSGLIVATGTETQLGAIAQDLAGPASVTPLQEELTRLSKVLGAVAVAIAVGVFALTLYRTGAGHGGLQQAFLSAVALAVAAVPEGLATVVTVGLALGMRRMAQQGAVVRRLVAVETLGSATVIATDKTGTLTQNRLQVAWIAPADGDPRLPTGPGGPVDRAIVTACVLCNDADPGGTGDAVDAALLLLLSPEEVAATRAAWPRVRAVPFEAERRRMTTLHAAAGEPAGEMLLLVKGAPEHVLDRCDRMLDEEGNERQLGGDERAAIVGAAGEQAAGGARVLAVARRSLPGTPESLEDAERELTLVGLVGLRDPIRDNAPETVRAATKAGVELVMVTGDHPATAAAVAEAVGLRAGASPPLTGRDLAAAGFPQDPLDVRVYARVEPRQKLALVEALQARGHVVAVTGDGVNDAPALRRADIGVAMGRAGSDVAREASDMVITDDDLSTVLRAIREGRAIYDNIRKVIDYLIAGNLSEIMVVVSSLLLFPNLGTALLPLQLLWVNLLTDGLPALALSVDPADPELMRSPPRRRGAALLSGRRIGFLWMRGVLIAAWCVGALAVARFALDQPWPHARALMFTVLVTAHLLYAFVARLPARPSLRDWASNRWLLVAVLASLALQAMVMTLPVLRTLFGTFPMSLPEWALAVGAGLAPVILMWLTPLRRLAPAAGR